MNSEWLKVLCVCLLLSVFFVKCFDAIGITEQERTKVTVEKEKTKQLQYNLRILELKKTFRK